MWRPDWPSRIFALTPLWVQLICLLAAPTYFPAMRSEYPNILVANLGFIATGLTMIWMLIGLYVLWRANTWHVAALVYAWFTIPATLAVLFGPALVLILQNPG